MEEKLIKLMSYLALIAVVLWVTMSLLGKRVAAKPTGSQCARRQRADGSVWARQSVPASATGVAAGIYQNSGV